MWMKTQHAGRRAGAGLFILTPRSAPLSHICIAGRGSHTVYDGYHQILEVLSEL